MPTANNLYQQALFRHATGVEGHEQFLVEKLVGLLNETEVDLIAQVSEQLQRLGPGGHAVSAAKIRRLETMLERVRTIRSNAWREFNKEMRLRLREFSVAEVDFTREAFSASVELQNIGLIAPTTAALRAATFESPFRLNDSSVGSLAEWMASLREADSRRIEQAIRLGFLEAEDLDSVIARVRGTRAARFTDGLLQLTRRQAETVVRTGLNHFANAARGTVWEANADIIIGLIWVSVLDGRTTLICQSRDGKFSPFGNNPVPPGLELLNPSNARPPAHAQCRSIMVAIISPEGLIGTRPFVVDTRRSKERRVNFGRMAKQQGRSVGEVRNDWAVNRVGRVPAKTTYEEFLRRQSVDFQDEVLGPTRAKLFRKGGLRSEDFVTNAGRRYSLEELRRRDAEAFRKAGVKI